MAAVKWGRKRTRSLIRLGLQNEEGQGIYIYIYTEEEKGKSWGVEANDINYSQSPGLKYPKNSRICSWTEAALVGPEYQVPLFKQGILPISPSPSPLTDPSSRSFHSFPLPFFFFFLFLLSSLSLIALFEISTPLICAHDGWKRRERKMKGEGVEPILAIISRPLSKRTSRDS